MLSDCFRSTIATTSTADMPAGNIGQPAGLGRAQGDSRQSDAARRPTMSRVQLLIALFLAAPW